LKERHTHLEKCAFLGRTTNQTLSGLSAVVYLSVGHYPCYENPNFSITNLFSTLDFSYGVFPGVSKILVFMCACFGFLVYASAACLVDYSTML
jgi:hypothetical protein